MAQLNDIITEDDVQNFRNTVKNLKMDAIGKDVTFPREENIRMEPVINGSRSVVKRCRIRSGSAVLADSEDMVFENEKPTETACHNAIREFEAVTRETFIEDE